MARNANMAHAVPRVGVRSGDTPQSERQAQIRRPPEILITTPESLYLLLTSAGRKILTTVETVIIDEIHAVAPTKRGAHLFLSLERLEHLRRQTALEAADAATRATKRPSGTRRSQQPHTTDAVGRDKTSPDKTQSETPASTPTPPKALQRIGLSATQKPLEEIAALLAGLDPETRIARAVTVVNAGGRRDLDVVVELPVEDLTPSMTPRAPPRLYPSCLQKKSLGVTCSVRKRPKPTMTCLGSLGRSRRDAAR